jgi:hypothetical protein
VATGSFDNVVVFRAGSESEVQSAIDRTQAGIIGAQPEIALGKEGRRLVADEAIGLINLPKRGSRLPASRWRARRPAPPSYFPISAFKWCHRFSTCASACSRLRLPKITL